jgi:hypothetical protein
MRATIGNMKKLCRKFNEPIAVPGVFAYSYETGEKTSACPGDYFNIDDDVCLKDEDDNEMVLVKEVVMVVMQDIDED